jgi:hypothetical protein
MRWMDKFYKECKKWVEEKINENLISRDEKIAARPLFPGEAIGEGEAVRRHDYPLRKGKEYLLEARFRNSRGQAFTDEPKSWQGTIKSLLDLDTGKNEERAVFVAAFNAITGELGLVTNTVHCRNESMEECAGKMARHLSKRLDEDAKVLIVGYQPAFVEAMSEILGAERVRVVDLDKENIGRTVYGVKIADGETDLETMVKDVSFGVVTGSSFVNATYSEVERSFQKFNVPFFVFGTSGAAPAVFRGVERWCPESK